MSIWQRIVSSMNAPAASRVGASLFGYDSVEDTSKRRQANSNIRSEDRELLPSQRDLLLAMSNDSMRNFSICRWAIGKHLDFVSRFTFSCQTKTPFDKQVQDLMEEYSNEPELCDVAGRHTLDRMVRMTEAGAVLRGDHLLLMLRDGRLQQIESDRLRSELGAGISQDETHGVRLDKYGKAISYKIWQRQIYGGYENAVDVPRSGVLFHGYFPNERSDQVRGVPLVAAGLNDFVDAYEWKEITKASAKLRASIGLIITSDAAEGLGEHTEESPVPLVDQYGREIASGGGPRYKAELGKGPFKLELDPGDDAKFLTDENPSIQALEFLKQNIGFALKALDLPLCFFDEGLTNFFGQRAALILYLESCKTKRRNLFVNILRPLTRWKIVQWVAQGRLRLPANADITKIPFSWHPAGCPYWNPQQEINADIQAIQSGLGNWEDIYMERTGRDWFADMERLKEQQEFIEKIGLKLDPKVLQLIMVGSDPSHAGSNPLSSLPAGGLAI